MSVILNSAEAVALAIKSRLEAITVAADCETDIGTKVFQGKINVDDTEAQACSVLIEGEDEIKGRVGHSGTYKVRQHYVLIGYAKCDPAAPNTTAHKIIRDLKRAVFAAADEKLGGTVYDLEYLGRNIGPRADGAALVMAYVEIAVTYAEDLRAP